MLLQMNDFLCGKAPPDTRVLLVTPHYADRVSNVAQTTVGPPLGLAYMAAVLEQRGFDVSILDANALGLSDQETADAAARRTPHVVGFTAVTPTVDQCARLAALVRKLLPGSLIVLGGIHPTVEPEDTLGRAACADLVVRGEADTRFADILEALGRGEALEELEGVSFRDADGAVKSTHLTGRQEDLDALPEPARHLLPMDRYVGPDGSRFTTMVGARGCPGRCTYCSVHQAFGLRLRNRAPEKVVQEMSNCLTRHGSRVFGFVDDTFTTNRQWVNELCEEMIRVGLHREVRWFCLTRVDRVDPELLALMKNAGCTKVEMGIESGDQGVLDSLGKGTTTAQVVQAFAWARRAGLETLAFINLFSPEETPASLKNTRALLFEADPDLLQASFCTPYPGTELSRRCKEAGITASADLSQYVFLAGPVMEHPRFTRDQMLVYHQGLLRAFYFRPRTVVRVLRSAAKSGAWKGFARTALAGTMTLLTGRTGRLARKSG